MNSVKTVLVRHTGSRRGWGSRSRLRWPVALALLGLATLAPVTANAQEVVATDEPAIVVTGSGVARAAAETATIQLLVGSSEGFFGPVGPPEMIPPEPLGPEEGTPEEGASQGEMVEGPPFGPPNLTEEDLAPVVQAMIDAGVEEDAIQTVTGPAASGIYGPGGPGAGFVEARVEQPSREQVGEIVDAVNQAVTDNGLMVQQLGVGYDVADCEPLEREAKQAAIEDARGEAEQLAELLGVTLGDLIQVSSYSPFGPAFPGEEDGGCPPSPETTMFGPGGTVTTPPFDPAAEAEAEVFAQVNMVFAMGEAEGTPTA